MKIKRKNFSVYIRQSEAGVVKINKIKISLFCESPYTHHYGKYYCYYSHNDTCMVYRPIHCIIFSDVF